MEYNEMHNLIEAEVEEASEKLELMALHQELQAYFNQPTQLAFKAQLKQRLLEESVQHRFRRRWKRFIWSVGSIAAALLVVALINPTVFNMKDIGNKHISQESAVTGTKTQVADNSEQTKDAINAKNPSEPQRAASADPEKASAGTGATVTSAPGATPVPISAAVDSSNSPLPPGGERFGLYGTGGANGARGASTGSVVGGPAPLKSATQAMARSATVMIYRERGREISSSEATEIARLFGFQEGNRASGNYRYARSENQSTLTIDSGRMPTTISFHEGIVNPGSEISVQTAINKARELVNQMQCLEGDIGEPRVRYTDSVNNTGSRDCIVVLDRWLDGAKLLDRSITVTVNLGSGEVIGFNAAANVFESQGSYPLISRDDISGIYGENLLQLELVMKEESDKTGVQLLVPHYLIHSRDSQGADQESLHDAIPAESR